MADNSFQCTVITPSSQVFDQQVAYASVPGWDGLFGVAPGRAPIVAKLADGPLRVDLPGGETKQYFVGGGFAQMVGNRLSLLTEEAIEASKINAEEARASLKEAEARKALTEDEVADRDRQIGRARAMLALVSK